MSEPLDPKSMDKRTWARYARSGQLDAKAYDRYLKSLPDLAEKAAVVRTVMFEDELEPVDEPNDDVNDDVDVNDQVQEMEQMLAAPIDEPAPAPVSAPAATSDAVAEPVAPAAPEGQV